MYIIFRLLDTPTYPRSDSRTVAVMNEIVMNRYASYSKDDTQGMPRPSSPRTTSHGEF